MNTGISRCKFVVRREIFDCGGKAERGTAFADAHSFHM
jgi:hypothetical protein